MDRVFANNKEKYLFHLEEFKKFKGSRARYCKIHELKLHMFSYYKSMHAAKTSSPFSKIEIEPSHDFNKVPQIKKILNIDPEWLAQLIHNLVNAK